MKTYSVSHNHQTVSLLTQFLRHPVEAEGELLNLNNQVIGERGKAGGSDRWEETKD